MSDKTLVLHVGPHKTGTTALQHRLLKSREGLAAAGYEYPEYAITQFGHHRINSLLSGRADAAGDVTTHGLVEHIGAFRNVILSSEDFIYLSRDGLCQLKDLLSDFEIQVVLFVRTPVDLWPSHWQELIKHGRDATLIEYVGALCGWNNMIDAQIMNPFVQASKFAEVFGAERLRIFCYDNVVDSGTDIFDFFWKEVLGIDSPVPSGERRSLNPSLPLEMIEMLRCLNEKYRQFTKSSPETMILGEYQKHQADIEARQAYADFKQAFRQRAPEIHLESTQELIRNRERMLLNNFGHRIENKAASNKLFLRDTFKRKIKYGERYWIDRFGFGGFVDQVLDELDVLSRAAAGQGAMPAEAIAA